MRHAQRFFGSRMKTINPSPDEVIRAGFCRPVLHRICLAVTSFVIFPWDMFYMQKTWSISTTRMPVVMLYGCYATGATSLQGGRSSQII